MRISDSPDAVSAAFERRAARARLLAESSRSAEAPLAFAAGLYRAQAELADAVAMAHERRALSGKFEADRPHFGDELRGLLRFVAASAPADLAERAGALCDGDPALLGAEVSEAWAADGAAIDYLSRALLRPYLEVLAKLRIQPERPRPARSCPFCGGAPWIATRRAAEGGDGARRFLGCSLCGGEWGVNRLRCPVCDEQNPDKLPSFQSERHRTVRIEACESCRHYLKSFDLTLDARQIPEVDDLVSLAMDLWAVGQGFTRVEPGLAGV